MARAIDIGRRAAIGALAAGAAGFVLLGPRGSREDARGRTVLDYWEKWTGGEGAAMREIVRRFNASQDRIVVRYLSMAGIDQRSLIAIAGGDPPDLVGLWSYSIPVFAEAGALTPLDELATAAHKVELDAYAPAFRPIMRHPVVSRIADQVGGQSAGPAAGRAGAARGATWKTWGAINTGGTIALYYNRELFRQAGLDPDRPPRTIEELDDYADRLTTRDDSGRLTRAGFLHTEPGWWTYLWGYQFGGSMWDPADERSTVDARAWLDAYGWVQRRMERLGLAAAQAFQDSLGNYDAPDNAFLAGKVAMIGQGPWLANIINAYLPELDYGVAAFPVPEAIYREREPLALIDCDVLVIPKGVRHPEASFEFLCFTQRQENVEFMATAHAKGSPMVSASPEFVARHPNRGVATHNALAQSPRAYRFPRTRTWTELKAEFDSGAVQIRRLERPAAEVLAGVQRRSQGVLDRAVAARERRGGLPRGGINTEALA